jgi:signal transduction histidine kinase
VLVEVRDEGCGLSEEELNRIAEPFFTKWRDHGGTGLGIPLSIGIVEAMGGSIMFESEVGVGTAARICLPAAAEKQEDDEV